MPNRLAKRTKYALLAQKLRALDRRRNELLKDAYVTVELEKPLFMGYEKFFIFRADVVSRPDFPILEKLLPLINTVLKSKNKLFTKRARRKTRQANKEKGKKTVDILHKTKDLPARVWERLTEKEQAYFSPFEIKTPKMGYLMTVYRWNFPWMLVAKVQKNYVTSIRIRNPTVQSERAVIENYIERHHLNGKIARIIYGHKNNDYYDSSAIRYRIREKEIGKEIQKELINQ